ncbi:MAG: hypothetical protein ACLGI3_12335 [Actinomycetes bacterium]
MTDTKPRRSSSGVVYWIEAPTTHYRLKGGRVYRDAWVRLADGSRQLWAVPAEAAAA